MSNLSGRSRDSLSFVPRRVLKRFTIDRRCAAIHVAAQNATDTGPAGREAAGTVVEAPHSEQVALVSTRTRLFASFPLHFLQSSG